MAIHTDIDADFSPDARFLASKERALAGLRTSEQRWESVSKTGEFAVRLLPLERASDVRAVSKAMHADLVPGLPTKVGSAGLVFDFAAAERGRQMSKRIEALCKQLGAEIEQADNEFLAEPDHFTTPRCVAGMVS